MTLDVHLHYHAVSGQWEIELRKMGARKLLARYDATTSREFVEQQAIAWADFLCATLTREGEQP